VTIWQHGRSGAEIDTDAAGVAIGTALTQRSVIREYPLLISGVTVNGIFAVWRDAEPILGQARRDAPPGRPARIGSRHPSIPADRRPPA